MENNLVEFSVEYQDTNGVVYYESVSAASIDEARMHVQGRMPDVAIRAVIVVPSDSEY